MACRLSPLFICSFIWLFYSSQLYGGGLQVTPVTLTFNPQQNSAGIWLSNNGKEPIQAQVRTFLWYQKNSSNELVATRDIIISPPMIKLNPNEQQLVRVIRNNNIMGSEELAYRLSINELPTGQNSSNKLQFVLHYSLPIFVQPLNMPSATVFLEWQLIKHPSKNTLIVHNNGNSHAQLSNIHFIDCKGKHTIINSGLLGYVLPRSTMQWEVTLPEVCSKPNNTIKALINGEQQTYSI
ncbi:molecular chaperone [Providencia stuartii]|uniref:fimbrial biogenesis chaperone n=1 Tax=Providencia TaxID=586 RepID=UPI000CE65DA0|nr:MULTISPECIES: molecular chaperone [Providencia]AVE42950.1 molecular chaperone [Providencia stuartii]MBQ0455563.1 molecular chaperone [Providencia stuartii]MBQ0695892.1 molecular chaperone [Providencia stuartii]MDN7223040.1 molecular chaperone [Providencia stuartii]MDQ5989676.1 molecular chaperone [Providencia stuartii]